MDNTGVPKRFSITNLLLLVNFAMFGLQQLWGWRFTDRLALWPMGGSPFGEESLFQPWQPVTHALLHDGWFPLIFNTFCLYMLGWRVEERFGPQRYLIFYFVCSLGAAIVYMIVSAVAEIPYAGAVGSSGALLGVLLAFAMEFPRERVMLFLVPIPIPAWVLATFYGLVELYFGVTQTVQGVGHFTFLGGMLTGFLLIMFWRQQRQPTTGEI